MLREPDHSAQKISPSPPFDLAQGMLFQKSALSPSKGGVRISQRKISLFWKKGDKEDLISIQPLGPSIMIPFGSFPIARLQLREKPTFLKLAYESDVYEICYIDVGEPGVLRL